MKGSGLIRRAGLVAIMAVVGSALVGCGAGLGESDVPYAAEMLDNLLAGITQGDYTRFSRDLSAAMKEAVTEEGFPSVLASIEDSLGEYRSRTFLRAGRTRSAVGTVTTIKYKAEYSKDANAVIMIWISEKDGTRRIEGFSAAPAGGVK